MQEFYESLGTVDLAALIIVLFNALMGLIRGFVWQLMRLATIIGGLCLARYFAPDVATHLSNTFEAVDPPADHILAYFVIFFAVFIAGTLLAFLLRKVLATLKLQSYDRLLGAVLGAVKGGAIVILAILLLSHISGVASLQQALAESRSARLAEQVIEHVNPLFPESIQEQFAGWLADLRQQIPPVPK